MKLLTRLKALLKRLFKTRLAIEDDEEALMLTLLLEEEAEQPPD